MIHLDGSEQASAPVAGALMDKINAIRRLFPWYCKMHPDACADATTPAPGGSSYTPPPADEGGDEEAPSKGFKYGGYGDTEEPVEDEGDSGGGGWGDWGGSSDEGTGDEGGAADEGRWAENAPADVWTTEIRAEDTIEPGDEGTKFIAGTENIIEFPEPAPAPTKTREESMAEQAARDAWAHGTVDAAGHPIWVDAGDGKQEMWVDTKTGMVYYRPKQTATASFAEESSVIKYVAPPPPTTPQLYGSGVRGGEVAMGPRSRRAKRGLI